MSWAECTKTSSTVLADAEAVQGADIGAGQKACMIMANKEGALR